MHGVAVFWPIASAQAGDPSRMKKKTNRTLPPTLRIGAAGCAWPCGRRSLCLPRWGSGSAGKPAGFERHELLSKQQSLIEEAAKGRFGEPVSQGRSTRGQRDWTAEQAALWLLGERRFDEVRLVLFTDDSQSPDREVDRAERLFPETVVFRWEEYRRSPRRKHARSLKTVPLTKLQSPKVRCPLLRCFREIVSRRTV